MPSKNLIARDFAKNGIYTYVCSENLMRIRNLYKHAFEENEIVTSKVQVVKIAVLPSKIEKNIVVII